MKYLKTFLLYFGITFILNLIISIFFYFDIITSNINTIFKILSSIISFLIAGLYIGKNTIQKAWLEGLKVGLIILVFELVIMLLFKTGFTYKNIIYYLLTTLILIFGSVIGINLKKRN